MIEYFIEHLEHELGEGSQLGKSKRWRIWM